MAEIAETNFYDLNLKIYSQNCQILKRLKRLELHYFKLSKSAYISSAIVSNPMHSEIPLAKANTSSTAVTNPAVYDKSKTSTARPHKNKAKANHSTARVRFRDSSNMTAKATSCTSTVTLVEYSKRRNKGSSCYSQESSGRRTITNAKHYNSTSPVLPILKQPVAIPQAVVPSPEVSFDQNGDPIPNMEDEEFLIFLVYGKNRITWGRNENGEDFSEEELIKYNYKIYYNNNNLMNEYFILDQAKNAENKAGEDEDMAYNAEKKPEIGKEKAENEGKMPKKKVDDKIKNSGLKKGFFLK